MWRKVRLYVVAVMGILAVAGAVLLAAPRAKAPVERKGRVLDTTTVKVGWTSVRVVKDDLLLKLKAGVDKPAALQRLAQKHGFTVDRQNKRTTVYKVKVPPGKNLEDVMAQIAEDGSVQYVEPNHLAQLFSTTPNDPEFGEQWALHNDDDKDLDAPEAWDTTTGSSSIVVAVIDSGIDTDHEDLSPNLWTNSGETPGNSVDDDQNGYVDDVHGWDFANGDNDPEDDYGHGTSVAGIIGAKGNNLKGIAGVVWSCKLMPLKVTDDSSEATYADLADAITYAADNGASIINISLGGRAPSSALEDAIDYAYEAGCVLIGAAGNEGCQLEMYPAAYSKVISVVATDHSDKVTEYSNYSGNSDVAAPGDGILSCTIDVMGYPGFTGTSASSALVSGVAALVCSHNTNLTNAQVMQVLRQGVDPISTFDTFAPWGRINAAKALARDSSTYQDLAVVSVEVYPLKPLHEQATTIKVTVQNQGNEDVDDVDVRAKIDGQQTGSTQTVDLDVGETTTLTWTSWSTPDADDTYTVSGEIETLQNETETADNTKDVSVTVDEDAVSDIRIVAMSVSDPFTDNSPMTLTITVQNVGTQTETDIAVKAYINDEQVDTTKTVDSLAVGATAEKTFSWTIPEEPSAEPYIFKGEAVPLEGEENDSDNEGWFLFSVVDTSEEAVKPQYPATLGRDMVTDAPWRVEDSLDIPVLFFIEDPWLWGVDILQIEIKEPGQQNPIYRDAPDANPSHGANLTVLDEYGNTVAGSNTAEYVGKNEAGWHRVILVPQESVHPVDGMVTLDTKITYKGTKLTSTWAWWWPNPTTVSTTEPKDYCKKLRLRLSEDPLPSFGGSWKYYDTHYHSISTWGHEDIPWNKYAPNKEWGGPLIMTLKSARAIGMIDSDDDLEEDLVNKVFATDHNCFFNDGYRPGVGPTSGEGNEWSIHLGYFGDTAGAQEVTLSEAGSSGWSYIVGTHLLVYGYPTAFSGPWHSGVLDEGPPNNNSQHATLQAVRQEGGYCYAAHPWAGIFTWKTEKLEDAIRNPDYATQTDFVFKGVEFWNGRETREAGQFGFSNVNPFSNGGWALPSNAGYADTMNASITYWHDLIRAYDHRYFSFDENYPKKTFVRKIYASGGTDAHGDFNYTTSTKICSAVAALASSISNNAYGKVRTYCEDGLDGFENGRSVFTDGPLIRFTLDGDGKFNSDGLTWHDLTMLHENDDGQIGGSGAFGGERAMLFRRNCKDFWIKWRWVNTAEFGGDIKYIEIWKDDANGASQHKLDVGMEDWDNVDPFDSGLLPTDGVTIYSLHGVTKGNTAEDVRNWDDENYHCSTNPVWAIPMDIDVYYEETHIAHNDQILAVPLVPYPIPANKLKFVFTSTVSMKEEPSVIEFKQLNSQGNSMAEIYPCTTSTWADTELVKDAKYTVYNSTEVEYDLSQHYPCPPYTFVVYIKNPKDCNGNELNPIATLFRIRKAP